MSSESGKSYSVENDYQNAFQRMESWACNVTLVAGVGGDRVTAHRVILASVSDYFSKMFTVELAEKESDEITLHDITGVALKCLISSCYSGRVLLTNDNIEEVLAAADHLVFDKVKEKCCEFLKEELAISNCLGIQRLAATYNLVELFTAADELIDDNFMAIVETEEFRNLSNDRLMDILKRDELNVNSEEDAVNAILAWVRVNKAGREEYLPELFRLVRFQHLNKTTKFDLIPKLREFKNHYQLIMMLVDITDSTPRSSRMGDILVIGGDDGKDCLGVEKYCRRSNTWTVMNSIPGKRSSFAGTLFKDEFVITGGSISSQIFNAVVGINVRTLEVREMKPMKISRKSHAVAVLRDELYVIGGYNGRCLTSVEKYCGQKNEWSDASGLLVARSSHRAVELNGCLFVVGGWNGSNVRFNSIERYNPDLNEWTSVPPMIECRSSMGIGVLGGFLYVVGGYSQLPTQNVEWFDASTNTWSKIASISSARYGMANAIHGSKLIAFGGMEANGKDCDCVEEYDPKSDRWTKLAPMNKKRSFFYAAHIK